VSSGWDGLVRFGFLGGGGGAGGKGEAGGGSGVCGGLSGSGVDCGSDFGVTGG